MQGKRGASTSSHRPRIRGTPSHIPSLCNQVLIEMKLLPPPPRSRHIYITLRPPDRPVPPSQPSAQTLEQPLNRHAAEAIADILNIEWGLSDLRLENGTVDSEDALKPILHALLISGTLPSLSLAGNKRMKAAGWRLLAVFLKKVSPHTSLPELRAVADATQARSLRFLDLSDTLWDKKGIDYLVQALTCTPVAPPSASVSSMSTTQSNFHVDSIEKVDSPVEDDFHTEDERQRTSYVRPAPLLKESEGPEAPTALQTLRMDGCAFRANVLEALGEHRIVRDCRESDGMH